MFILLHPSTAQYGGYKITELSFELLEFLLDEMTRG